MEVDIRTIIEYLHKKAYEANAVLQDYEQEYPEGKKGEVYEALLLEAEKAQSHLNGQLFRTRLGFPYQSDVCVCGICGKVYSYLILDAKIGNSTHIDYKEIEVKTYDAVTAQVSKCERCRNQFPSIPKLT